MKDNSQINLAWLGGKSGQKQKTAAASDENSQINCENKTAERLISPLFHRNFPLSWLKISFQRFFVVLSLIAVFEAPVLEFSLQFSFNSSSIHLILFNNKCLFFTIFFCFWNFYFLVGFGATYWTTTKRENTMVNENGSGGGKCCM